MEAMEAYWQGFAGWATGPLTVSPIAMTRAADAFIDIAGCILAGRPSPAYLSTGGLGDDAPGRAFRLATAGHALEIDDYARASVAHPTTVVAPVVLALSLEQRISGQEALTAYIAGLEMIERMGEAVNPDHYERGWHATATLGTLGAAVAAGRLMGLDQRHMLSAMAIAASAAGGLKAQFGTSGKALHAGFAAMNGLRAADLARHGAEGAVDTLCAFAEMTGPSRPRLPGAFGDPTAIEQDGLVVKLWPCCGYLGRLVPEAIDLATQATPDQIAAVEITMPPRNMAVAGIGRPRTPDEARFSPSFCVAAAMIDGALGLDHFDPSAIGRPDIACLMARTRLRAAPAQRSSRDLDPEDPDVLTLRLTSGREVTRHCAKLPGSSQHPVTREALLSKTMDLARPYLPERLLDAAHPGSLPSLLSDLPSRGDTIAALAGLLSKDHISGWAGHVPLDKAPPIRADNPNHQTNTAATRQPGA